jgi:hypothetical protein
MVRRHIHFEQRRDRGDQRVVSNHRPRPHGGGVGDGHTLSHGKSRPR